MRRIAKEFITNGNSTFARMSFSLDKKRIGSTMGQSVWRSRLRFSSLTFTVIVIWDTGRI
jgi:hypothetical protein